MNIVRVKQNNYQLFADMVYYRLNGIERKQNCININELKNLEELKNPNLYLYAAIDDNKMIGWISIVYIPKVGKYNGRGYLFIDEIWVFPQYRNQGVGTALMKKADELFDQLEVNSLRLYVDIDNEDAIKLYKKCGYKNIGTAIFMEKVGD